jgi:hypothetical protein
MNPPVIIHDLSFLGYPLLWLLLVVGLFFLIFAPSIFGHSEPPRQQTPEDRDQNAVLLRAKQREYEAQTDHDAARLKAEMARAELEDALQFLKTRNDGGRHV